MLKLFSNYDFGTNDFSTYDASLLSSGFDGSKIIATIFSDDASKLVERVAQNM